MSRPDSELATLLRDAAPQPDPEFLDRLDARVDERFGAPERPRRAWAKWPHWKLAGGLAAACAAAVVVAVAVGGGGSESVDRFEPHSGTSSGKTVTSSLDAAAGSKAAPPESARQAAQAPSGTAPAPAAVAPAAPTRKVIRDTQLALTATPKEFATTTDGVIAVSDRFGGIVQRSNIDQTGSAGHASFDLRIPASRLDDAMAALSKLAHVRSRSAASQDVTAQYLSASERVANARAQRRGILRALAKADTAAEIESLKLRLRDVDSRLARARGDLASLRHRVDYVRVAVTVDAARRGEPIPGTGGDDRWTPGDALRDAGHILQTAAGIALIILAIALPLALIGGLAALGGRTARRRRREAALG